MAHKRIVVSGYFDPLHVGHLELLKLAKELGDKLIVIVNNDEQTKNKKGKAFMSADDRAEILKSIKYVDEVIISIDEDGSQCKTLEHLKPDVFANGGDRGVENIPEFELCKKLGIEMIDGLGEKIRSSSGLVREAGA